MAPFPRVPVALLLAAVVVAAAEAAAYRDPGGRRDKARLGRCIFAFGNSLTDTGNAAINPVTAGGTFTRLPYGETYFGHPSGRASDGRIFIDFLVEELKLPQPTPYLAGRTAADFQNGVNFAVGGATALEPAFLESQGVKTFVPVSLNNETRWFENVVQQLGSSAHERRKMAASSIFLMGEMGINDYFEALLSNHTIDQVAGLVPHVVGTIRSAITAMIAAGARTVVATSMTPLGCAPYLLTMFPGDRDAAGCNTRLNGLAELHNRALNQTLAELRRAHPGSSPLYADVYGTLAAAVASPAEYGFGDTPLAACCGAGGGAYNFNFTAFCGDPGSTACAEPSKYVSWDGIHFTEAANRFIASAVLKGLSEC
ncbi:hypothetical protein ACP4OV_010819 [Aristida adscensionis]